MILSAGMIIARQVDGQWLYLFLRAYKYWDFPKGEVKEGERPFAAALREVREETGLAGLSFPWGRNYMETDPYGGGRKKARYYLAATAEAQVRFSVNPEIGRPEHHEYRWLPADELEKLAGKRLQPLIGWARKTVEEEARSGAPRRRRCAEG